VDQEARQEPHGYKNHVSVDRRHKLVRRYQVTDAATHDSQVVDDILDPDNTTSDVWADSAYRSAEIEAKLEEKGLKSRIHRKGLPPQQKPCPKGQGRGIIQAKQIGPPGQSALARASYLGSPPTKALNPFPSPAPGTPKW
jgi:hypothetical protein